MDSWGPYLSPEYLLNFPSNLYIPAGLRKSHGVQINGKSIFKTKNWIYSFLLMLLPLLQVLIITLKTEGKYQFSPGSIFSKFIPPPERGRGKGEDVMRELKKWPKLNLSGSEVLINPTMFVPFIFLVAVLLYRNLDSSMLKC